MIHTPTNDETNPLLSAPPLPSIPTYVPYIPWIHPLGNSDIILILMTKVEPVQGEERRSITCNVAVGM